MPSMRAVQFTAFGSADVLRVNEVPVPAAGPGEVLIRVEAAGINPHDLGNRSGAMKVITGKKFPFGSGLEFAGEVVAGGSVIEAGGAGGAGDAGGAGAGAVAGLVAGQKVWGSVPAMKPHATGALADYVVVPADRVSAAPAGLSAIEAASLVVSTTTAIRALRELGDMSAGDEVLIRGAAGGVGLAAVQVAVAAGATVTTLSSARDFDALRRLGATTTLDYRTASVKDLGSFDVIFDTVGTRMLDYRRHVAPDGRMVTIVFSSLAGIVAIGLSTVFGSRRIRTFSSDAKTELLNAARDLADRGQLRPTIANVYALADIAQAHRDQEAGGVLGKRVVAL